MEISEVKRCLADEIIVEYEGIQYYPIEYVLYRENGEWKHSIILRDIKANSVIKAPMNQIKITKQQKI